MHTYMIEYGCDNDKATFSADSPDHAVEQFVAWSPISDDEMENAMAINNVFICIPCNAVYRDDDGIVVVQYPAI